MTLEPPWSTFDLPEPTNVVSTSRSVALSYPDTSARAFDRAMRDAGWSLTDRSSGSVQVTSAWERDGWRISVNQSRRAQLLDVRIGVVGIPEDQRWSELRLPLGPATIARDNDRELGLIFAGAAPEQALTDEMARLAADGWTATAERSARTQLVKPEYATLTVWAEPVPAGALVHIAWGGPPEPPADVPVDP